ncbi:MAG: DUF4965 domain-containing protein [Clostridia bacterium]|nr:DUF4965 domain-containing protein [Clostridia bacterium]
MLRSRTAAYPLITCDPFFSVWSMADELTTPTRHWTGRRAGLYGYILKGGKKYVFMGECPEGCEKLAQKSVEFSAHFTEYSFAGDGLELKAGFFTPYFFDDLASVTVPVSYIYTSFKSDAPAELHIELDGALIGAEDPAAASCSGEAVLSPQTQKILCESGDDCTAKWGYLHILHKNAYAAGGRIGAFTGGENDHFTLGYDSVKAISFMGEKLDGYYKIKYADFNDMISAYDKEFCQNLKKAEAFDKELETALLAHGEDHAFALTLACRQSVGAHKLAHKDGKPFFISKECFSNGCAATLDVTYPSIPLYLRYAPELVRGMLRPLFEFAKSDIWTFDFAPHDCGQFPLLEKQVYGLGADGKYIFDLQMPVEECGNAIICTAAAAFEDGDMTFANEYRGLFEKWARFLTEFGYCPANQLCTDDFAGHLDKNCNLSLTAIVALACLGKLFGVEEYSAKAREFAANWVRDTKNGVASALTVDRDGWSLKYNIVWDKIYSLGLFGEELYGSETALYTERSNAYGTPLDSRAAYTKLDWLAWTSVMGDEAYLRSVFAHIARMIRETPDRVPLTDWYDTETGKCVGFRNRTVVGGLFITQLIK